MTLIRILGLSVLMGSVAAGFIWFGWGLVENLLSLRRGAKSDPDAPADGAAQPDDKAA